MAEYSFMGMQVNISDNDQERKGYFEAASRHQLVIQKCKSCNLLRWYPGSGCSSCGSLDWVWQEVSGKGTIHSYEIVTQAIIPGFSDLVPYPLVLVELDEQRGVPEIDDGVRLLTMLVDNNLKPEKEINVAVGKRVEVVFMDVGPGFSVPQFRLSSEPAQVKIWQYQQK